MQASSKVVVQTTISFTGEDEFTHLREMVAAAASSEFQQEFMDTLEQAAAQAYHLHQQLETGKRVRP